MLSVTWVLWSAWNGCDFVSKWVFSDLGFGDCFKCVWNLMCVCRCMYKIAVYMFSVQEYSCIHTNSMWNIDPENRQSLNLQNLGTYTSIQIDSILWNMRKETDTTHFQSPSNSSILSVIASSPIVLLFPSMFLIPCWVIPDDEHWVNLVFKPKWDQNYKTKQIMYVFNEENS